MTLTNLNNMNTTRIATRPANTTLKALFGSHPNIIANICWNMLTP